MEYARLGTTGMKVSRICLGCWSYGDPARDGRSLNEEQSRPYIHRALELGISFFDTANICSNGMSAEATGRALSDFARRDEVVIATKVRFATGKGTNNQGLSRKHILSAIAVIPFSLLAHGWLARKPSAEQNETLRAQADAVTKQRYDRADNIAIVQRVSAAAEARGLPMAQMAWARVLSRPFVTVPITGATWPIPWRMLSQPSQSGSLPRKFSS